MSRKLEGKVAVVTGASRGIGKALAELLAENGARVWAGARTISETLFDRDVAVHPLNVKNLGSVDTFCAAVLEAEGGVDILVNNAGVLGPRGPLADATIEEWEETIDVNLNGVFRVTKGFLGALRADGIVVNVSSSVGRKGRGGWGPYAASKHGLEGLNGTLADELEARRVTVVSVNPGGTATEMRAEAYPEEDPDTLPSAAEVASIFVDIIESTPHEETGAQLNVRDRLSS